MFSIKNNECVSFESRWKVKRVYSEGTSQTTEYSQAEMATNTSTSTEIATQTQEEVKKTTPDVDMQKLADWLTKIFPKVQRELTEAVNSKAFNCFYTLEEATLPDAKLTQTLNVSADTGDGDVAVRVSALSWNSTGNTLAVACTHLHKTWCHRSGQVSFYTFNRSDKLPETLHKKLATGSCVSILRFHPTLPSVVACGTNSVNILNCTRDIIIWNIQHDEGDSIIAKANGHKESLTDASWIYDIDDQKTLLLATSSLDGCLKLWNFNLPSASLAIKHVYKVKSPVLGKIQRSTSLPEEIAKKVVRGVLSLDFSTYVPDMFVVGVEGGLVVQCSMLCTNRLKGSTAKVPISYPVFKYYEPHEGEISSIRFSPNRRDMFMTTASDGEIRIYLVEQDALARVIFLEKRLSNISWVPYQEKLITGCGERGTIEIFHVINGRSLPNVTSEKIVQTSLLQMAVNKQRCTTVAVGNDRGELQLWNVPWSLFAMQKLQS